MRPSFTFFDCGESALLVDFGPHYSKTLSLAILDASERLAKAGLPGLRECVPALSSLTVFYDPLQLQRERLISGSRGALRRPRKPSRTAAGPSRFQSCMAARPGPDLDEVAATGGHRRGRGRAPSRKPALPCLYAGLPAGLRLSGQRAGTVAAAPPRDAPRPRPRRIGRNRRRHDRGLPARKPRRLASDRLYTRGALGYGAARGAAAQARRPGALRSRR